MWPRFHYAEAVKVAPIYPHLVKQVNNVFAYNESLIELSSMCRRITKNFSRPECAKREFGAVDVSEPLQEFNRPNSVIGCSPPDGPSLPRRCESEVRFEEMWFYGERFLLRSPRSLFLDSL